MQVLKSSKPHLVALRGKLFDGPDALTSVEELQAKVIQLESQLRSQKETADKGIKLMHVIYGSKFDQDFLF